MQQIDQCLGGFHMMKPIMSDINKIPQFARLCGRLVKTSDLSLLQL